MSPRGWESWAGEEGVLDILEALLDGFNNEEFAISDDVAPVVDDGVRISNVVEDVTVMSSTVAVIKLAGMIDDSTNCWIA